MKLKRDNIMHNIQGICLMRLSPLQDLNLCMVSDLKHVWQTVRKKFDPLSPLIIDFVRSKTTTGGLLWVPGHPRHHFRDIVESTPKSLLLTRLPTPGKQSNPYCRSTGTHHAICNLYWSGVVVTTRLLPGTV